MSDYDFIIDNMKFSYSNISTFETCAYAWKLTYIDTLKREPNFFAEFGTLCHDILEKYFKGELDLFNLPNYYEKHFYEVVQSISLSGTMTQNYYDAGYDFFTNIDINPDDFEILESELKTSSIWNGIELVVKPDIVLKEKSTGKIILMDYKTSIIKKNKNGSIAKSDIDKLNGYKKQLFLYAFFLSQNQKTKIEEFRLWFIRNNTFEIFQYTEKEAIETLNWFMKIVAKIKEEEKFIANISNPFFCNNLCGVRMSCEFRIQNPEKASES